MAILRAESGNSPKEASQPVGRWSFPALCYALLPLLLVIRHVNAPPDKRTYGPSHWFLDYHHGFMRRALVGQLLSHIHFISWHQIFLIEAVVLACGVALTYLVFRSILFGTLEERLLGAFLLAAPAFLPHMAAMGGELDNILYVVVLLAAYTLIQLQNSAGLVLATLLVVVALAIHEAFLLMFYPLLLVLLLHLLHRRKISALGFSLHLAVIGACFLAILFHGRYHGPQAEWVAHAQQRTDMPIETAVMIPLNNTLREQVLFVRERYTHSLVGRVILSLLLSIPYGVALWRLLSGTLQRQRYTVTIRRLIIASFFIPLLLIPLGHDIMRWMAALCINISLYILLLHQESQRPTEPGNEAKTALRSWARSPTITATFLYLLALGPWSLAGTHLFSNLHTLVSGQSDSAKPGVPLTPQPKPDSSITMPAMPR